MSARPLKPTEVALLEAACARHGTPTYRWIDEGKKLRAWRALERDQLITFEVRIMGATHEVRSYLTATLDGHLALAAYEQRKRATALEGAA